MPLKHSKTPAAFSHNVAVEMDAGKPQDQAVAIAYSEKRKAEHKKHMAMGGSVDGCEYCEGGQAERPAPTMMSDGGEVSDQDALTKFGQGTGWGMAPLPKPKPILSEAEGGEIEEPSEEDMGDDMELHDALGSELLNAIATKDKKSIMSCIEACVLSCMNKE